MWQAYHRRGEGWASGIRARRVHLRPDAFLVPAAETTSSSQAVNARSAQLNPGFQTMGGAAHQSTVRTGISLCQLVVPVSSAATTVELQQMGWAVHRTFVDLGRSCCSMVHVAPVLSTPDNGRTERAAALIAARQAGKGLRMMAHASLVLTIGAFLIQPKTTKTARP